MATPPPVVVVPKKRGLGCFGCGCLTLLVLLFLLVALIGGGTYYTYATVRTYTSAAAVSIPSSDAGDDVYQTAKQKLDSFTQGTQQHQPVSLHLNSDEINTLIARDPDWIALKDRVYITLKDGQARIQTSLPLNAVEQMIFTDRYLNADGTFTLTFDADEKEINLAVQNLHLGERDLPSSFNDTFNKSFNPSFNAKIKQNSGIKDFLDRTQKCTVENNELVIETQ